MIIAAMPEHLLAAEAQPKVKGYVAFDEPRPMPPIIFEDREGRTLSLADFKGRVVLIDFWATWCAPCRYEMPALDRLQFLLGDRGFTVLDLSQDRDGKETVERYFARYELSHLDVFLDPAGRAFRAWDGRGVPRSLLIGRDGRARGEFVWTNMWDTSDLVRLIEYVEDDGS